MAGDSQLLSLVIINQVRLPQRKRLRLLVNTPHKSAHNPLNQIPALKSLQTRGGFSWASSWSLRHVLSLSVLWCYCFEGSATQVMLLQKLHT